jgi:uncharacterized linocin/CFP29 family protein
MNHLMRELAPVTDAAWTQIDEEAARSLKLFLAARRLVDFIGPLGWSYSAVDTGRIEPVDGIPSGSVESVRRRVHPLVEHRAPFTLARDELDTVERGGNDPDLHAVIDAGRAAALAEDHLVFNGDPAAGIAWIITASPHEVVPIGNDYSDYPVRVAKAVTVLRSVDIAGPYAIALGTCCYTGVTETIEHGGYPVLEHLRQLLGGPVVWAPAIEGAVVLSQRGGDYALTVGQDFSVGYRDATGRSVDFYIEESIAFQVNTPEAAVHLAHS